MRISNEEIARIIEKRGGSYVEAKQELDKIRDGMLQYEYTAFDSIMEFIDKYSNKGNAEKDLYKESVKKYHLCTFEEIKEG